MIEQSSIIPMIELDIEMRIWYANFFKAKRATADTTTLLMHMGYLYPVQSYHSLRSLLYQYEECVRPIPKKAFMHLCAFYNIQPREVEQQCIKYMYERFVGTGPVGQADFDAQEHDETED